MLIAFGQNQNTCFYIYIAASSICFSHVVVVSGMRIALLLFYQEGLAHFLLSYLVVSSADTDGYQCFKKKIIADESLINERTVTYFTLSHTPSECTPIPVLLLLVLLVVLRIRSSISCWVSAQSLDSCFFTS